MAMKILIILATLALLAALAVHSAQTPETNIPFPPEVLKAVPGISQLKLVRLQQRLAPLGREFAHATPEHKRELVARYRQLLEGELTHEQMELASQLPHDEEGMHRYYRHRLLQTADLRPEQRTQLQRLTDLADRLSSAEPSRRQLRQRYWQLVALLLEAEQMARFNRSLPELARTAGNEAPDYIMLPDVSGSQANRLLAQFRTLEAETAADRTKVQQLEQEMAEADEAGKATLQTQLLELRVELLQRRQQMKEDVAGILTPSQRQTMDSYPPGSRPQEYFENVERLVSGVGLKPEQKQLLDGWREEYKPRFLAMKAELERRQADKAGADMQSPGGMERLLAVRELQEPIYRARLEAAKKLVGTFDDQQMEAWLSGLLPLDHELVEAAKARFEAVNKAIEERRRAGQDVTPVVAMVEDVRKWVKQGELGRARHTLEQAEGWLRRDK